LFAVFVGHIERVVLNPKAARNPFARKSIVRVVAAAVAGGRFSE
jgi:hypothetical protein